MAEPNIQKPSTKKDWDSMSEAEKEIERKRLAALDKEAERPDPAFDKSVDQQVRTMQRIFKNQKWFPVTLFQVTKSMKAEGQKPLPDRECGINGYNFIVPRGRMVKLPESLVRILYNAGEVDGYYMVQAGLMSAEEVARDAALSAAEAERLAQLGSVQG